MEEKNVTKISLSTFLLIIAIIVIIIMGAFIYKLNNDKTTEVQKSSEPVENINKNIEQEKSDSSVQDNTSKTSTNFFGLFKSSDGIYKYAFLPNGEMCYINEKSALDYKTFIGTYQIEGSKLYYSLNAFKNWFELRNPNGSSAGYFKIVDNNTLEYGSQENDNLERYTRNVGTINGTYSGEFDSIKLNNNKFEISSYESETLTGNYTINNNMLLLNYSNSDNNIEKWYILDNDTIILERYGYYHAYLK